MLSCTLMAQEVLSTPHQCTEAFSIRREFAALVYIYLCNFTKNRGQNMRKLRSDDILITPPNNSTRFKEFKCKTSPQGPIFTRKPALTTRSTAILF